MMLRGPFGRDKIKAEDAVSSLGSSAGMAPAERHHTVERWPWDGQRDEAACNAAAAHLFNDLQAHLSGATGIHAETCLTAIGAIAGFSAQRALFARIEDNGDEALLKQMHMVRTQSGGEYFYGEPLNRMLVPMSEAESNQRLWSLAVGGAVSAGLDIARLPELRGMFAHVATTLGREDEGLPSVGAKHHPHWPARELLRSLWPLALMCFSGRFPHAPQDYGLASKVHWPVIAARVAGSLMPKMPPALDQRIALTILMEAAIYASKLKPSALDAPASRIGKSLH
jgi:hypothetical protein